VDFFGEIFIYSPAAFEYLPDKMKRICSVNVYSDGLGTRNRIFGYIYLESAKKWLNSRTVES